MADEKRLRLSELERVLDRAGAYDVVIRPRDGMYRLSFRLGEPPITEPAFAPPGRAAHVRAPKATYADWRGVFESQCGGVTAHDQGFTAFIDAGYREDELVDFGVAYHYWSMSTVGAAS
jgi:hypothetical protein